MTKQTRFATALALAPLALTTGVQTAAAAPPDGPESAVLKLAYLPAPGQQPDCSQGRISIASVNGQVTGSITATCRSGKVAAVAVTMVGPAQTTVGLAPFGAIANGNVFGAATTQPQKIAAGYYRVCGSVVQNPGSTRVADNCFSHRYK